MRCLRLEELSIPSTGRSWLKRLPLLPTRPYILTFNTLYGSFLVEARIGLSVPDAASTPFNTLYGSFLVEAETFECGCGEPLVPFNTLYGSFLVEATCSTRIVVCLRSLSIPSTGRSWLKRLRAQLADGKEHPFNTLYGSFLVEARQEPVRSARA